MGKAKRRKSKRKGDEDTKQDGGGDVELVAMGKSQETKELQDDPSEADGEGEKEPLVPTKTERPAEETTWQFDTTGKMTIHSAPTDSNRQQGVPDSCGGAMMFYGSIVWLILVVIGIEVLCLFMGTCFAYDNPSVSVVVTGAIFPLFVVVACVATAGIITAQGLKEDMLKTESRSRLVCQSVSIYFGFALVALIALAYFTAVSVQGVTAISAVDAVEAGLALTWDSLNFQQQRLFDNSENAFNEAKQTNMVAVAVFGMVLVVNGFVVVSGCGTEVARLAKTLQTPELF
eukprot:INCI12709.1.p1 GENE.INCI12709.1~~INCI12709.1.p1  ORF type:complete len:288 (-),score=61.06 INCI12709.1:382-1245(-)